jgi:hypothetical protein
MQRHLTAALLIIIALVVLPNLPALTGMSFESDALYLACGALVGLAIMSSMSND